MSTLSSSASKPDAMHPLLVAFFLALTIYTLGLGEALLAMAQTTFVGLFLLIAYLTRQARSPP